MKKISIYLVILCLALTVANSFLLYSQNEKLVMMRSKLFQLEAGLSEVRNSTGNKNNIQGNTNVKEKEVFTPSELAEYLNINMDQVYDMIDSPDVGLPYINVGGEYRFGKGAIDEWLGRNNGTVKNK